MKQRLVYSTLGFLAAILCITVLSAGRSKNYSSGDPGYKGRGNMVDKYYQELVNKSPELKIIETELRELQEKQQKLEMIFSDYDNESKAYYNDAKIVANAISDSAMKRSMMSLITKSNEKYASSVQDLNTSLSKFIKNDASITDHHRALKLVRTMAAIEKYQKENRPSSTEFNNFTKEQEGMIEKIKVQTPKYQ